MSIEINKLQFGVRTELTGEYLENQKIAIRKFIRTLMLHHIPNMSNRDKKFLRKETPSDRYDSYFYYGDGTVRLTSMITSLGYPSLEVKNDALFLYIYQITDDDEIPFRQVAGIQTRKLERQVDDSEANFLSGITQEQFELMEKIIKNSKPISKESYNELMGIGKTSEN